RADAFTRDDGRPGARAAVLVLGDVRPEDEERRVRDQEVARDPRGEHPDHVCSTNAFQPSRSSRMKFGVDAARTRAGRRIRNSKSALAAYVPASTRSAVPLPIVATIAPPVAAPTGNET